MKEFKKISGIKADYLLIFFLILTILPFLILNYFNHPASEDFFYGEETKRVGFSNVQRVLYKFSGGRYFTNALICYTPLYFKSMIGYKVSTFLLMLAFFYVLFLFISKITKNSLTFRERFLFSLSIFFLYLYAMPSIREGFYYLGSVICYHLAFILILIFFIFYIRLGNENNLYSKIFYIFISCLAIIAVAGSNELGAILIVILIISLIIKNFFIERKIKWSLIFFALVVVTAVYISFSAPGNYKNFEYHAENYKFFDAIYNSFTFLIQSVISWSFNSPLLIVTLLFIPIFSKIIKKREANEDMFSINPIYTLTVWFIFLFSNIFMVNWSAKIFPYDRTLNFIYFVFLIGWFYNIIVLTSYINTKFKFNLEKFPKYIYAIAFIIIVFFLLKENNIKTAYTDLLTGIAYKYDNELNERYNFILQNNSDSIEVERIKNIPKSFYSRDVIDDSSEWFDQAYASYFNKKSIVIKSLINKSNYKP